MENLHLHRIGQELADLVRIPGDRAHCGQLVEIAGKTPGRRIGARRITRDVDGRRVVGVDFERSRIATLRGQQTSQIGIDFADLRICARGSYAVTIGGTRRTARKVIAFVRRKNEQRIVVGNPIGRQAGEELIEGIIVGFERRDVTR